MTPWMRVASGKYIDLSKFSLDDVDLTDVVKALGNIQRCNGHGGRRNPLSVLQHSILVCDLLYKQYADSDLALAGLLHDAHEAYIGDTTSPVKTLTGFVEPEEITVAVRQRLHWNYPTNYKPVRTADLAALEIERKAQWVYEAGDNDYWPDQVLFISEAKAVREFDRYQTYGAKEFYAAFDYHGGYR